MESMVLRLLLIVVVFQLDSQLLLVCCQRGFTSISCGASSPFTDSARISWQPDTSFVSTGQVSSTQGQQPTPVRYFPLSSTSRNLNCFQVPVPAGIFLTRATFAYGNYDQRSRPPSFQLVLNQTIVSNVNLQIRDPWVEEVVWKSVQGTTYFCLLGSLQGKSPVIASLELRPLAPDAYNGAAGLSSGNIILRKRHRINCGETTKIVRYPGDPADRIWDVDRAVFPPNSTDINTYNGSIRPTRGSEILPLSVLQTSRSGKSGGSTFSYILELQGGGERHFVVCYFAQLINSTVPTPLDLSVNGALQQKLFIPESFRSMSYSFSVNSSSSTLNLTLQGDTSSVPMINALEVYEYVSAVLPTSLDVGTLGVINSTYSLGLSWNYDPCLPVPWNQVKCSATPSPQITSLDLSSSSLVGQISPVFGDLSGLTYLNLSHNMLSAAIPREVASLTSLQILDLSFNQLLGALPDFSRLKSLRIINLQNNNISAPFPDYLVKLPNLQSVNIMNNNFTGSVPSSLDGRVRSRGNPCLGNNNCFQQSPSPSESSGPKSVVRSRRGTKNKTVIIAGAAAGGAAVVTLCIAFAAALILKKGRRGAANRAASEPPTSVTGFFKTDSRKWLHCKEFTYKDLSDATNGFKNELGRGSFGPVYYGKLDGHEVAIKRRTDSSSAGAHSFINEVSLLSRVHHQNLVTLVGFCQKSKKHFLVYEYMPGGNLTSHLYGSTSQQNPLDWKTRLSIAIGAAAGLNYLHNGSDPKIIHRDVKTSNILLDSAMTAKISDFGLSKHVRNTDVTHVTTLVKGTAGYLDPEYYISSQLTEKSDVFSFGVVLFEILCGREALSNTVAESQMSLIAWAKPLFEAGAFKETVDKRILGKYKPQSVEVVTNVACKCVDRVPSNRPTINEVLRELKYALALEQGQ